MAVAVCTHWTVWMWWRSGHLAKKAGYKSTNEKVFRGTQILHPGCSKAENFCAPPQTPFPGVWDSQNLISWRWSLTLPTNPVWWGSMHAISSYRVSRFIFDSQHTVIIPPVCLNTVGWWQKDIWPVQHLTPAIHKGSSLECIVCTVEWSLEKTGWLWLNKSQRSSSSSSGSNCVV